VKKYGPDRTEDAENRYLDIARSYGWCEDAAPSAKGKEVEVEEIDWDTSDDGGGATSGGGSGMGPVVSTVGPPKSQEESDSLHVITLSGDSQKLESFLDKHADIAVDEPDEFGYTAMQLACDRGYLTVVQVLLQRGASPNLKDPDDLSTTELAKIAGHDDIVQLLEKYM